MNGQRRAECRNTAFQVLLVLQGPWRRDAMAQAGRLLRRPRSRATRGARGRSGWDKGHELRDDVSPGPRHGSTPNTRKDGRSHAGDGARERQHPVTGTRAASWLDSPNQATGSCSVTSTFGSSPSEGRAVERRGRRGREIICVCEATGYEEETTMETEHGEVQQKMQHGTNDDRHEGRGVVELTLVFFSQMQKENKPIRDGNAGSKKRSRRGQGIKDRI